MPPDWGWGEMGLECFTPASGSSGALLGLGSASLRGIEGGELEWTMGWVRSLTLVAAWVGRLPSLVTGIVYILWLVGRIQHMNLADALAFQPDQLSCSYLWTSGEVV